jgi:hypothetical protein
MAFTGPTITVVPANAKRNHSGSRAGWARPISHGASASKSGRNRRTAGNGGRVPGADQGNLVVSAALTLGVTHATDSLHSPRYSGGGGQASSFSLTRPTDERLQWPSVGHRTQGCNLSGCLRSSVLPEQDAWASKIRPCIRAPFLGSTWASDRVNVAPVSDLPGRGVRTCIHRYGNDRYWGLSRSP